MQFNLYICKVMITSKNKLSYKLMDSELLEVSSRVKLLIHNHIKPSQIFFLHFFFLHYGFSQNVLPYRKFRRKFQLYT